MKMISIVTICFNEAGNIREFYKQVVDILKAAFPGREIATVDPTIYNIGSGGGMHCSFQQEPATSR